TLGVRNKRLFEAVPALQGARSPLRPPGYAVDASPILFAVSPRLRHGRKTRYGWVASPYPTSGRNTARATVGGEFPSYTLSVVQRVPHSTMVHVSASPPLIPDSRISRVRLAAIACPHRTFPHLPRLKRS